MAVTKTWPARGRDRGRRAGLTALGENRVQEALPKIAALPEAEWHLIGHLQSNKARAAVAAFECVHAVDSIALLARLEAIAHDAGRQPQVLLQVNLTGEPPEGRLRPVGTRRGRTRRRGARPPGCRASRVS